jgi:hypothetical protein
MWGVTKGDTGNWGIEGYDVPRDYFDHIKSKGGKDLWAKINNKKLVSRWPPKLPKDDNDRLIWPKRPNYINDVIKFYLKCFFNKLKLI